MRSWRPDSLARRRANLELRGRVIAAVREFFAEAGFVEVDTPALQVSPGLEPHLKAFATVLHDPLSGAAVPRYLHTSPEFAMKKLLAGGMERIWQLCHVFRDGERGATHHPEFVMIEWYRAGASYRDIMADCEALLRRVQQAAAAEAFRWQTKSADARRPWQYITVADAFRDFAGIDLLATMADPRKPNLETLAVAARQAGVPPHPGDDWETLFFRIMLDRIEPRLGIGAPTVLYDYPLAQAALARRKPEDPRLAERFELYVCGLELANAFGELTNPVEQRARFEVEQRKKQALYGETYPIDEDFLAALEHGLPGCAGIALGFDRLVMLAAGAGHIEDVLWLPVG
ncbi:MAG TPA: EF-P lysine aminoacylase EpmA [Stellaceae bacterium]|jgi:lysyl-tRNA synthetase class 2|nr:EF-P lysine aminoacylase EpmA [Stellaceae bacterium]